MGRHPVGCWPIPCDQSRRSVRRLSLRQGVCLQTSRAATGSARDVRMTLTDLQRASLTIAAQAERSFQMLTTGARECYVQSGLFAPEPRTEPPCDHPLVETQITFAGPDAEICSVCLRTLS